MARIRSMKPETWEDEKLGALSVLARLNFQGLISLADDEGRGHGSAIWLLRRLHPYSRDIGEDSMRASLDELEEAGLVVFYVVGGQRYYCLPNFLKHQKIDHPTQSRLPEPHRGLAEGSPNTQGGLAEGSRLIGMDGMGMEGSGMERIGRGVEWNGSKTEESLITSAPSAASATAPAAPALIPPEILREGLYAPGGALEHFNIPPPTFSIAEVAAEHGLILNPPRPPKKSKEEIARRKAELKAQLEDTP